VQTLNLKKGNMTVGYRRLANKYKSLEKRANVIERKKTEVVEAYAAQLAEVDKKLVKETHDYTDYRKNVQHNLRELHEVLKASLQEVGARCLSFPAKNAPIDDYIGWFE
jgi:hypothetical protein